jgi:hypothetical protein
LKEIEIMEKKLKCACGKETQPSIGCECVNVDKIEIGTLLNLICSNCSEVFPVILGDGSNCPNCSQPLNLYPVCRVDENTYANYYSIATKEIKMMKLQVQVNYYRDKQKEINLKILEHIDSASCMSFGGVTQEELHEEGKEIKKMIEKV